jgi:hypothetical protein
MANDIKQGTPFFHSFFSGSSYYGCAGLARPGDESQLLSSGIPAKMQKKEK